MASRTRICIGEGPILVSLSFPVSFIFFFLFLFWPQPKGWAALSIKSKGPLIQRGDLNSSEGQVNCIRNRSAVLFKILSAKCSIVGYLQSKSYACSWEASWPFETLLGRTRQFSQLKPFATGVIPQSYQSDLYAALFLQKKRLDSLICSFALLDMVATTRSFTRPQIFRI
jgi:hypothetical protein